MKSDDLSKLLSPFKHVALRSAQAPKYKVIELAPGYIRACATHGLLELLVETGVPNSIYVDTNLFLAVIQSLPPGQEVGLASEGNVLEWNCGQAKGRLACVPEVDMPAIPDPHGSGDVTSKAMAEALEYGSLSSNPTAIGSDKTHGVVIYTSDDDSVVCSTDSTTISMSSIGMSYSKLLPEILTLPPPGADLLAAVIDDGYIEFDEKHGLIYRDKAISCMVKPIRPLNINIRDMCSKFNERTSTTPIPQDRITAFVRRVTALTENRRDARVTLEADNGQIVFSFSEGIVSSDEYFLAEVQQNFPPVSVNAVKMAQALPHVHTLVLDYMPESVLVMIGDALTYLVSGAAQL